MTSRTPREIITDTVLNMPAGLPAADQVERIVEELRLDNYHFAKVTMYEPPVASTAQVMWSDPGIKGE